MAKRLTPLIRRFCHEYVVDFHPESAAKRAGYAPSSARGRASYNLRQPHVRLYVDELKREIFPNVDRNYVVLRLQEIIENPNVEERTKVQAIDKLNRILHLYTEDEAQPGSTNIYFGGERVNPDGDKPEKPPA